MIRAPLALALALGCVAASAVSVRAGDKEAEKLLEEAYGHWNDPEPKAALDLAEKALRAGPESPVVRSKIQLFMGSLHQAKTGDLERATAIYDDLIRSTAGTKDMMLRQLRAQAMVRKGNIVYAEKQNIEEALQLFEAAHSNFQLATSADTASQLCLRMARERTGRSDTAKKSLLERAERLAREAIARAKDEFSRDPDRRAAFEAKAKLQLVLVLTATGKGKDADEAWASLEQARLGDAGLYQLAVLDAMKGQADAATEKLKRFMDTRPTAKARNQLRKFIRTEPDFTDLRARDDWKVLVEDEPV